MAAYLPQYSQVKPKGQEANLADLFVRHAAMVQITPYMLDVYAPEYENSMHKWETHAVEMNNLWNINRNFLTWQIKPLEASLAQLNTEYSKEELEVELVWYKLLYAELMHKSEDAASSHQLSMLPPNRK
ncbi:hypothetical protein M422DRAFT_257573 [Sphaerobolus stellatus SS14]|uniref:Uncharacterized protein n=1 Tax=Sphaerobolus stellatus (strain SS14) TaxID=990650 RepID=A0A0C9VNZ8_SPHS4|nr:hypothetical protein M422DRAFT_257573 [Sphaerobolus stellatus SS14]